MSFRASNLRSGYGRNAGKRWRAGDIAELRALVNRGASLRTISLKLGRPDSAIRSKANAIGLSVEADAPAPAPAPERAARPHAPAPHREPVRRSGSRQLELFG